MIGSMSSAMKEVSSSVKDISAGEVKQSVEEDFTTKDVTKDRLSKLEEEVKKNNAEDYNSSGVTREKLERLEKEVEQPQAEETQDVRNQSETQKQDVSEKGIGGSYGEVREHVEKTEAENKEVHHMPADSVSPLERNDGPAIEMDKEDHRQTASCGNSREAREYRAEQRAKIENGDFDGAFQMDVDDLHDKFGDKYDDQIEQAKEYKEKLKQEGRI